jgi:hypothetical protein
MLDDLRNSATFQDDEPLFEEEVQPEERKPGLLLGHDCPSAPGGCPAFVLYDLCFGRILPGDHRAGGSAASIKLPKRFQNRLGFFLITLILRIGLAGSAIPVFGVGNIRLFAVQVRVNPHCGGIIHLLHNAVSLIPVAVKVVPQSAQMI